MLVTTADLAGLTGIVTGGCGPLGWAIVERLSSAGARVWAVDLPAAVQSRAQGEVPTGVDLRVCDLLDRAKLNVLADDAEATGVDFLVNNAAFTGDASLGGFAVEFDQQSDDAFDAALELNLAVPFRLVRRLAPALRRSGRGTVVNIASIYGLNGPDLSLYDGTDMGNPAGYAASKGGLVQLTRYLSTVLAPAVRVNCVAPGGIERAQDENFIERYAARTPMGRMGREEDMVGAVAWFIGAESRYVTGQVMAVDGGWTAW